MPPWLGKYLFKVNLKDTIPTSVALSPLSTQAPRRSLLLSLIKKQPPEVFCKKSFLKNLEFSRESTCVGTSLFFQLYKMRLQHRCFLVKFSKFLRTPILKNICERLFQFDYVFDLWESQFFG